MQIVVRRVVKGYEIKCAMAFPPVERRSKKCRCSLEFVLGLVCEHVI